jgi:hypothetical protein
MKPVALCSASSFCSLTFSDVAQQSGGMSSVRELLFPTAGDRPGRRERAIVVSVLLVLLAIACLQRRHLLNHIDPYLTFAGGIAGLLLGLCCALLLRNVPTQQSEFRRAVGYLTIVALGIPIGTYLARELVETVAFFAVSPHATVIEAPVLRKRRGRYWGHTATFVENDEGREVDVNVTSELYERLQPYSAPARDCLVIRVETGRYGLRRSSLPNFFDAPFGVEHFRRCNSAAQRGSTRFISERS